MFILAAGLLARAAVGPVERLLNMLGEQRACAIGLCHRLRDQSRPVLCADPVLRRGRCGDHHRNRDLRRIPAAVLCDPLAARPARFHLAPARGHLRPPMHAPLNSQFWVEWRPLDQLDRRRRRMARARRSRARAQRVLFARPLRSPRRPCSAAMSAPVWSGRRARRNGWSAFSRRGSNSGATARTCRSGRLDPSLCAARHAAGRPRPSRAGDRRLACSSRATTRNLPDLFSCRCCRNPAPRIEFQGGIGASRCAHGVICAARPRGTDSGRGPRPLSRPSHRPAQAQGTSPAYRRLAERGALQTTNTTEPKDINSAVETFLHRGGRLEGPRRHGGDDRSRLRPFMQPRSSAWRQPAMRASIPAPRRPTIAARSP